MVNSLRVMVVDEEPGIRDGMAFSLKRAGFVTGQARSADEALQMLRPGSFDVVVSGLRWNLHAKPGRESHMDGLLLTSRLRSVMPTLPILHILTPPSVGHPIESAHMAHVVPILVKPFSPETLVAAVWRAIRAEDHLKAESWGDGLVLITLNLAYSESLQRARRAAESRAYVLIESEIGCDGERLAKLIHLAGPRRGGAWVTVRCPDEKSVEALIALNLESELKGAEGGTLLLDEVWALNPLQQSGLLQYIRNRTGRGSGQVLRIISLSSRSLEAEVKAGRFREELFYLLGVVPVRIPPLRERLEDLSNLAAHILEHFGRANGRPGLRAAPSFLTALSRHSWPGNVRELESAVQRAAAMSNGPVLTYRDLGWLLTPELLAGIPPDPLERPARTLMDQRPLVRRSEGQDTRKEAIFADPNVPIVSSTIGTPVALPLGLSLHELERFWLLSTLSAVDGNRTRCADQLGLALRTVRNKLNEYRVQGFEIPMSARGREED